MNYDLQKIDALVAKHIMGWEFTQPHHGSCCTCQRCGRSYDECDGGCEYSDDIVAAWEVIARMRELGWYSWHTDLTLDSPTEWYSWHFTKHASINKEVASVTAKTAPLAICLAALKAIGIKVGDVYNS